MVLSPDTVAIPVVSGINVNTPARLLEPTQLLEATNVRFPRGAGAKKRRGHSGQRIRGAKAIPASWTPPAFTAPSRVETYDTSDRALPEDWLFGFGYQDLSVGAANPSVALQTSDYPDDGLCFGMTSRDNEALAWTGHRLLSRTTLDLPGGQFTESNAVMPALRSEPIAKANTAQRQPDCADNGIIRVATWISGTTAYYSVADSTLGTAIVPPTALSSGAAAYVRCVPVGTWVHILIADSDSDQLEMRSVHQDAPAVVQSHSLGDCNGAFDIWKHSDEGFVVAKATDTTITVRVHAADGQIGINWAASVGTPTLISSVAVCLDPVSAFVGLVWRADSTISARVFDGLGSAVGAVLTLGTVTAASGRVAVAPKYLATAASRRNFNAYWDDTGDVLKLNRFNADGGSLHTATRYHHLLGSQAFRVGDRTFVWGSHRSDYQSTWILFDEELLPVGHADYVTANTPALADFPALASVNWWGTAPAKDRVVYHCALSYRVRVAVEPEDTGINPPAVYTEPSIHFIRLDFLPPLRGAQAGRCVYFAGAQLWAYDGGALTEAAFHYAPEDVSVVESGVGDLTSSGEYIWRVDLCHRNAQNEEVRSASFYTDQLTLTSATAAVLTIPSVMTRREDSYFLIFRNQSAGTLWKLCNSRDPASALFVRNDQSVASVTFTDSTVSDAELDSREQHPNQSFEHLDPFAAPASEVIAAGRDRLWLAGGEIGPGQVLPSRLFESGETPAFHLNLAIQVDRNAEPITAIGFIGEYSIFFRRNHAYIEDGAGPDNETQGTWNTPRLALSDLGAVGPEGLALIGPGLLFQSPAGIRLLTPGGGLAPVGQPVDLVAKDLDITSALVVSADQEVRFYSWTGETLVYNYQYNTWSKWTVAAAGAIRSVATGLALLCTPTGSFFEEADGIWNDNGLVYKMRVRFAWLRAGELVDFQRVRRIAFVGEASTPHSVHVDVYYNERDFAEEWFDWEWPDVESDNQDTFGTGNFGDGNFGDVLP